MKKSRIIISMFLALMFTLSIVAMVACTPNEDNPSGGKSRELVLWAPSNAQTFYTKWANEWAKDYTDSQGNTYTVALGIMGEGDAGTTVMNAPEDAADVYLFADDQLEKLIKADAIASVGDPTAEGTIAKQIADRNLESSVQASIYNGQLYAYPMQSDNCYFLFYDSSVLSASDVEKWDTIWEKTAAAGKQVAFDFGNAWYQASWFFTFGGTCSATDSNFGSDEVGLKACKAAYAFSNHSNLLATDPDTFKAGLMDGTVAAGVAGTWIYDDVIKANPNIKLAILPKVTLDGQDYQMKSFLGSKLMGVNAKSPYLEAAHALANFLTDAKVQEAKAQELSAGPSNKAVAESDVTDTMPTLSVVAAQAAYSHAQGYNLPAGFWDALPTCVNTCKAGSDGNEKAFPNGQADDAYIRQLLQALITAFNLSK